MKYLQDEKNLFNFLLVIPLFLFLDLWFAQHQTEGHCFDRH